MVAIGQKIRPRRYGITRAYVYMNFFDQKDVGNHLLKLCPKVVKHPVYLKMFSTFLKCLGTTAIICLLPRIILRYCNRFYQRITRQKLCKLLSAPRSGGTRGLHNPFLSNSSVNTLPCRQWHQQQQRRCFLLGLRNVVIREVTAVTELVQGQLQVSHKLEEWLQESF
jgi:hypothetical protein